MKRKSIAALHIRSAREVHKVAALGNQVLLGLTEHATTFPTPSPSVSDLDVENYLLTILIGEAKGGDRQKIQARNEQSAIVLKKLKILTNYVNGIADGDKAIILLSGFDAADEPTPQPAPPRIVIRRIVDGSNAHSAKIHIESIGTRATYFVETTATPTDEHSWQEVLRETNSRKLIIENLDRGTELYFRVSALNSTGQGPWSDDFVFLVR